MTQDSIEREANAWIRRLTSGNATVADADALKRWCANSAAHARAFANAQRLWQAFGPAGEQLLARQAARAQSQSVEMRHRHTRRAFIGGAFAAGAAAIGVALVPPPLGLWPSLQELNADYRTATGEQKHLTLAGGVAIDLNTQTSIAMRNGPDMDAIELLAGQAAVWTGRAGADFAVIAGDGRIVIRNTGLEVRHVGTKVCVSCLEGKARIEHASRIVVLQAGQQASYDATAIGPVAALDTSVATAWREGLLIFRQTALREVVKEINRYRPGLVVLLNANLGKKPVSGRFRIDKVDQVLTLIQEAFGAKLTTLPGGVVLLA